MAAACIANADRSDLHVRIHRPACGDVGADFCTRDQPCTSADAHPHSRTYPARQLQRGDRYEYLASFRAAAASVLGSALGERVYEDLLQLQDIGLDRLGAKEKTLRERYTGIDHAGAREIIAWLDGEYRITDEIIAQQSGE